MKKIIAWGRYLFLEIFLLTLYFLYGNAVFIVLFFWLVGMLPISYYFGKQTFSQVDISISNTAFRGSTGERIPFQIHALQQTIFPLLDATISYTMYSSFSKKEQSFEVNCPIGAKASGTIFEKQITYCNCGGYQIRLDKLVAYDLLHLFQYEKTLENQVQQITIFPIPKVTEKPDANAFQEGFEDYESQEKRGIGTGNASDTRAYVPGDRLQRIHWKQSAKIGKWMVKEAEAITQQRKMILPEFSKMTPNELELTYGYLYGFSLECLFENMEFEILIYQKAQKDFWIYQIQTEADLEQCMIHCFYLNCHQAQGEALEFLKASESYQGEIIYITKQGADMVILS